MLAIPALRPEERMRMIGRFAIAAAGLSAAAILTPISANAAVVPNDLLRCSGQIEDSYYDAYCSGSRPTMFQAEIACTNNKFYLGSWEYAGDNFDSVARCPKNTFVKFENILFYAV
jgi:hypothetical protein